MSLEHRYNRDEISKILKRAAELEHQHNVNDDSEGLTVQELQQVSKEVGLHPKYIRMAAEELEQPSTSIISKIIGGPFKYRYSKMAEGSLSDEKWEEMVAEIRRVLGNTGKRGKFGKTFEWELREDEGGYVQIYLSPEKGHTSIRLNANYKDHAALIYGALGTLGVTVIAILIPILVKKAGLPVIPLLTLGGIGIVSFAAGLRFYLSRWMKKKRETHGKLVNRLREILSPEKEKLRSSSVTLLEIDSEKDILENNTVDKNREKTK